MSDAIIIFLFANTLRYIRNIMILVWNHNKLTLHSFKNNRNNKKKRLHKLL